MASSGAFRRVEAPDRRSDEVGGLKNPFSNQTDEGRISGRIFAGGAIGRGGTKLFDCAPAFSSADLWR
jgi:hypothetical protein